MKALVIKDTKVVIRVFEDDTPVVLMDDGVEVGRPADEVHFFIGFCNADSAVVYEDVQVPADFFPQTYLFDGSVWAPNNLQSPAKPE